MPFPLLTFIKPTLYHILYFYLFHRLITGDRNFMSKIKNKKIQGKTIFNATVIILSLLILAYFSLSENGLSDLIENFKTMDTGFLIMAIFCNLINLLIDAFLIYILTKSSHKSYKFRSAFRCSMTGQFFSAVTPFSTGGQPMQIYLMSKQGVEPGVSTSMLVQKFLVYQSTLTTYSALSILLLFNFLGQSMNSIMMSFAIFGFLSQGFVIFLLLLFSFNKKLTHLTLSGGAKLLSKFKLIKNPKQKIDELEKQLITFHESNKELFKNRKLLLISYVLTTVQLTAIFIIPYCIYRAFNLYGAKPIDMICSQAFVTMTSCFIPLPGAAGASEVSFVGFFSMYFSPETIKSAVLLWRIITYYSVILFTAPFSRISKREEEQSAVSVKEV